MNIDRFFSVFKTAGRGLAVQREQISVASENIANANTTKQLNGTGPYRPKTLVTSTGSDGQFFRALENSLLQMDRSNSVHLSEPSTRTQEMLNADLGPRIQIEEREQYRFEYDPDHPDADENGMVKYPDVDLIEEMTRMVNSNRLYEANLSVIEAEKTNIKHAFEI